MNVMEKKELIAEEVSEFISLLRKRFEKNMNRHNNLSWDDVEQRMKKSTSKLWSLHEMERTGGEPDVVKKDASTGEYIFMDCSAETPKGRRNVCYDEEALESRKEHKPNHSAVGMAAEMGIELLNEQQYRELQDYGPFDTKTSSWLTTPADVRKHGGAIFGDYRYGRVFIYHNGAQSYYGVRGFRGALRV